MTLRIATWNCAQRLAEKADRIAELDVDLVVVPECGQHDLATVSAHTGLWCGENATKGLGVWSPRRTLHLEPVRDPSGEWRWLMQVAVTGLAEFHVLAVWAFNHRQVDKTPLARALDLHRDFIGASPTIVLGDFNNNAIWDRPGQSRHADTVACLDELGMSSAYHVFYGEAHGEESRPTYWRYRHRDKPYHIDYCYVPSEWNTQVRRVDVGTWESWSTASDHAPLIVEFDTL